MIDPILSNIVDSIEQGIMDDDYPVWVAVSSVVIVGKIRSHYGYVKSLADDEGESLGDYINLLQLDYSRKNNEDAGKFLSPHFFLADATIFQGGHPVFTTKHIRVDPEQISAWCIGGNPAISK